MLNFCFNTMNLKNDIFHFNNVLFFIYIAYNAFKKKALAITGTTIIGKPRIL